MDLTQFGQACANTLALLTRAADWLQLEPKRMPENATRPPHLAWMLGQARAFYEQGKVEKANRWLGYVQGCMASYDFATVEELKRANMPEGSQFDGKRL